MEEADEANSDRPESKGSWITTALFLVGLGSLGPGNIYLLLTDSTYLGRFDGWKILILPFGAWLLTGFLFAGLTIAWAGFNRLEDWDQPGERAWKWWVRLGLWLLAALAVLISLMLAFSGLSDFISELDRGTALIAGLLFLILLALWRIGDQMKRG